MKITKTQLKQIIKEELEAALKEETSYEDLIQALKKRGFKDRQKVDMKTCKEINSHFQSPSNPLGGPCTYGDDDTGTLALD